MHRWTRVAKNDETGASAYDPRVMLKIVLLAYSQGLISSRVIERACARNIQFIAISGDSQPGHAHIGLQRLRLERPMPEGPAQTQ